jgi:hypothetical protein
MFDPPSASRPYAARPSPQTSKAGESRLKGLALRLEHAFKFNLSRFKASQFFLKSAIFSLIVRNSLSCSTILRQNRASVSGRFEPPR